MILITPLLLMFSYIKTRKSRVMDVLIPLAGVFMIVFIYVDKMFGAICELFVGGASVGGKLWIKKIWEILNAKNSSIWSMT
ncbi:MAG: hypothetical protein IKN17_13980 [Ruminococcus sp.]|nr:hypothetical protein [Ruminococcus sp.]MBR6874607.1 hypothetical protein [Ruminococcus sp.]